VIREDKDEDNGSPLVELNSNFEFRIYEYAVNSEGRRVFEN
jgi:hypothetical protein